MFKCEHAIFLYLLAKPLLPDGGFPSAKQSVVQCAQVHISPPTTNKRDKKTIKNKNK